jgi:hypothetical protein
VIAMLIENGQRADLNAIEEARSSLDAARFVVAAMWEFLAEAYDWGPDELAEFADLIGVQVAQQPTWGQPQQAVLAAIREMRRVDDLAGVLLAIHALRIEPTLADEEWNEEPAWWRFSPLRATNPPG